MSRHNHVAVFFRQHQTIIAILYIDNIAPPDLKHTFDNFWARVERESDWAPHFDKPDFLAAKFLIHWAEHHDKSSNTGSKAKVTLDFMGLANCPPVDFPPIFEQYYIDCPIGVTQKSHSLQIRHQPFTYDEFCIEST